MKTVWLVRFTGNRTVLSAAESRSVTVAARGYPSIVETTGGNWTFYGLAESDVEARTLARQQASDSGIEISAITLAVDTHTPETPKG